MSWEERLDRAADELSLSLDPAPRALLVRYLELLDHWNRRINLTALDGSRRVRQLVLEPIWVARELRPTGRYLDIGSGNGSPAIPWCAFAPRLTATLVEARARRTVFLRHVCRELRVNAEVLNGRFGELPETLPGADWVTLQGVRLGTALLDEIRQRLPGARLVWLTRNREAPEPPLGVLRIPASDREALVFGAARTSPGRQGGQHGTCR